MKEILDWLDGHRTLNALLATAFFLAVVLFHGSVTTLAIQARNNLGVEMYNFTIALVAGFVFIALLLFLVVWMWRGKNRVIKITWTMVTVFLMLVFYRWALTYNIEAIHFIQYMILAILMFPLLKSYGTTVFWVTLLGMLDEAFQYLYLTPFFRYFDFNDIILNLIGAGLGVVMIFVSTEREVPVRKWYRLSSTWALGTIAIVVAGLSLAGEFRLYPDPEQLSSPWITLNREPAEMGFWTEAYAGRFFHIISPLEGVLIMIALFIFYQWLDRASQRSRIGA